MKNPEEGTLVTLKSHHPMFNLKKGDIGVVEFVSDDSPPDVRVKFNRIDDTITTCSKEVKFFARDFAAREVGDLRLGEQVVLIDHENKAHKTFVMALSITEDIKVNVITENRKGDTWDIDLEPDDTVVVIEDES